MLLERGEVYRGFRQNHGVGPWLASRSLPPDDILAAGGPSFHFGPAEVIDIAQLAPYPLLLLEAGYSVRVQFNAACRLANVKPIIAFESRATHTVLALAEAGQGAAILPSLLREESYAMIIVRATARRNPVPE